MMTPFPAPANPEQEAYNTSHTRTRVKIEQAFGILKSRFRCLHKSGGNLQYSPVKCAKITVACMVLHNRCVKRRIPLPEDFLDEEYIEAIPLREQRGRNVGAEKRNNIVLQHFS